MKKRLLQFIEHLPDGWMRFKETIDGVTRVFRRRYRIRKLTPKECFRLMGLRDTEIAKIQAAGISESQQYKLAGNSIVTNVLEGIFIQMFRTDSDSLF